MDKKASTTPETYNYLLFGSRLSEYRGWMSSEQVGTTKLLRSGCWKVELDFHSGGECTYKYSNTQVRKSKKY